MTAIDHLRMIGYEVWRDNDKIRVKWLPPIPTPPMEDVREFFDDIRARRDFYLAELRREEPVNVFDPANRLPEGIVFATECDEHHGCFIAYRIGTKAPVGHGPSQAAAVLNLADLEAHVDHAR